MSKKSTKRASVKSTSSKPQKKQTKQSPKKAPTVKTAAHTTTPLLTAADRIAQLRSAMRKQYNLDAYYVPSADPHQSEYVPACFQRRTWLSGFTGSMGDVIIGQKTAGLWTDGRYFLQAEQELQGSGIDLFKLGVADSLSMTDWIKKHITKGKTIGCDPRVLSLATAKQFQAAVAASGGTIKLIDTNLVDQIWHDRPALPASEIWALSSESAGQRVADKLKQVRKTLKDRNADALVITTLDAIAWLFNIRGGDVMHNPVVIANALVTQKEAVLFTTPTRFSPAVRKALGNTVELYASSDFADGLKALNQPNVTVWVDGNSVNQWVVSKLSRCTLITDPSPIVRMKAKKNAAELAGMRQAHVRDGAAMVQFLQWLDVALATGESLTESTVAEKLSAFRAQDPQFIGTSFDTIPGYQAHGAIIHYHVTPHTDVAILPGGIFLIDSGAHYRDGTTDITRTLWLGGTPSAEQKDRYTRVLKGHIAIATLKFPNTVSGRLIDAFARRALWDVGLDYAHGTGHGVGHVLNVHEGPQSISATRCTGIPLEEGNILSNEPGFYEPGEYGIRIENLVEVVRDETLSNPVPSSSGPIFLCFEPLTLCPIDTQLIDLSLITASELAWLNNYHQRVYATLSPLLPADAAAWLQKATAPIEAHPPASAAPQESSDLTVAAPVIQPVPALISPSLLASNLDTETAQA